MSDQGGGSAGVPSVRWSLKWYIGPPFPGPEAGTGRRTEPIEQSKGPALEPTLRFDPVTNRGEALAALSATRG
jgi:hypothetical protein